MSVREGIIPTTLGSIVTTAGVTLVVKKVLPKVASGILGFGLAHIVLGSIDLVQHKKKKMLFR
ncbi:MAG: asparagine synthase [Clostridium sp.]|uniref:asparagine synthase n=1 Tax=Clostridium sp. TaxID=1506 RepID=UPI0039E90300